jgi:rod shape-determining protein MreD
LFVLFQVFILNHVEIAGGMYIMTYPLFLLLLPFEMSTVVLMLIAFLFGLTIDAFSNTFGLHASAAVVFAFFRPLVFKLFSPRDGYENVETSTIYSMGFRWFLYAFGLLLLIHHTWYFIIEQFKWNESLLIIRKLLISLPASFGVSLLIQFIFVDKKKKER